MLLGSVMGMLVVLPPSETKAAGGERDGMDVSFSALDPIRSEIMADLAALGLDEMMAALKLPATKRAEAAENQTLHQAPVMPAIHRYTGVLYDALDASTLSDSAISRLAIGSALFGVVLGTDTIPRYRLSGGSKLPAHDGSVPTMKARWGTAITNALLAAAEDPELGNGLIVDMRSGAYQQLGPVPGAVTVRVESVLDDGSRKVVSHFNKHYKGELARILATAPDAATVNDIAGVAAIADAAGMTVELDLGGKNPEQLTLVV